jgi:hypothetical protein
MVGSSGNRRRRSLLAGGALAVAAAVFAALLGAHASGGSPTLALRSIGAFDQPIYVTSAPGASGFLYVAEQGGRIRVVDHGTVRQRAFLNVSGRVAG